MELFNLFISPINKDKEGIYKTYLISKVVIFVAFISLLILCVLTLIQFRELFIYDYVLFILTLLVLLFLIFLKKNVPLVNALFIFLSWLGMSAIAGFSEGIHDATIVGYIVIMFFASLVAGYRMAILMSGLSILSVWFLAYLEIIGYNESLIDPPLDFSRDFTIIILMAMTLIILYEKSFIDLYNRVGNELKIRKKTEQILVKNELLLKEQNEEYLSLNEELTESNNRISNINHELTAAKERAEESERLKTAFLQNISHEVRTPLNGIIGFNQLIKNVHLTETDKKEYLEYVKTSCDNLAALMDDLIDMSRIETGIIDLHLTTIELMKLFNKLELLFSAPAKEKGILLSFSSNINSSIIETDCDRLEQILKNLISNAIKFTPGGFVKIEASQAESNLIINVTDSGIGIKKENLEMIFDRFSQSETGLTRSHGGTGLGLPISKGLIEHLGGKISVISEPGNGSAFSFSIPVKYITTEKQEKSDTKISNKFFVRKLRILIAEDEDINFYLFREILKNRNCEITRACNGAEAFDLFNKEQAFDVILMDIKMPVMNGYDATLKIRAINDTIPIIAVTAFDFNDARQLLREIKFNDYITKPIAPDTLFERINNIVNEN